MKVVIHNVARLSDHDPAETARILRSHLSVPAEIREFPSDASYETVAPAYAEADVLVTRCLDASHPPAPRLKLLQVPAAGADLIDRSRLPPGCRVRTLHDHGTGASEFVMAAMLEWCVGIGSMNQAFRTGRWTHGSAARAPLRPELQGRTLSIIGMGTIGTAVAKRAKAFGMVVETLNRKRRALSAELDASFLPDELPVFLARSDFLLLACPLTPQTQGLIDRTALAHMKPDAVLINTARAAITVESDLFDALKTRRIAGAILDVWWHYPTPDAPHPRPSGLAFHELPNVIMTPHVATWSASLLTRRWTAIGANIASLSDEISGRSASPFNSHPSPEEAT